MLDRISLKELGCLLDYHTTTSVKSWCKRHKITIHKDGGKNYIFRYEYDRVDNERLIKDLKEKYGEKWEKALELALRNELYKMSTPIEPQSSHSIQRYKPKGKHAIKFTKANE